MCDDIEGYRKVMTALGRTKSEYYTYTPKSEKTISMLLKGVDPCFSPEEVFEELKNVETDNLKFTGVKPFSTANSRKRNCKLPFFIVSLSPNSKVDALRYIKHLNHQTISWEKIRKTDRVLQCMRCQRFGHAASNCHMQFRCVKCLSDHIIGECPLGKEQLPDRKTLSCVLCKNTGHTANFRGCPKFQQMKLKLESKKKQVEEEKKMKTRSYNNFVAPCVSYAQMAGAPKQPTSMEHTYSNGRMPAPEAQSEIITMLLTMQGQFAEFQKTLTEQRARIDTLYSTLFSNNSPHQNLQPSV